MSTIRFVDRWDDLTDPDAQCTQCRVPTIGFCGITFSSGYRSLMSLPCGHNRHLPEGVAMTPEEIATALLMLGDERCT